MRSVAAVALLMTAFLLSGCAHVVIGGTACFSPEGRYQLLIQSHAKSKRSYSELTEKRVSLAIVDTWAPPVEAQRISMWAILRAGDLTWKCTWLDQSTARINFFDRNAGSGKEVDRGFVLIRKQSNSDAFYLVNRSGNIQIRDRSYFLLNG